MGLVARWNSTGILFYLSWIFGLDGRDLRLSEMAVAFFSVIVPTLSELIHFLLILLLGGVCWNLVIYVTSVGIVSKPCLSFIFRYQFPCGRDSNPSVREQRGERRSLPQRPTDGRLQLHLERWRLGHTGRTCQDRLVPRALRRHVHRVRHQRVRVPFKLLGCRGEHKALQQQLGRGAQVLVGRAHNVRTEPAPEPSAHVGSCQAPRLRLLHRLCTVPSCSSRVRASLRGGGEGGRGRLCYTWRIGSLSLFRSSWMGSYVTLVKKTKKTWTPCSLICFYVW